VCWVLKQASKVLCSSTDGSRTSVTPTCCVDLEGQVALASQVACLVPEASGK
jgi:hypothetical protein